MTDQREKVRHDNGEEFAEMRDIGTMVYKKHSSSLPGQPKPPKGQKEMLFSWHPSILDMHLRLLVTVLGFAF
jgi:hypothetical protein